jgi:PAS domain S-box-containing protein
MQAVLIITVILLAAALAALGRALLGEREARRASTEREKASRESEELWRRVFEFAPDGYVLMALDGTLLHINRAAEDISGLPRDRVEGRSVLELGILDQADLEQAARNLETIATGRDPGPVEYAIRRADGSVRQAEVVSYSLALSGRNVMLGILHDITERRRVAEELALSRRRLEEAQRVAGLVTWELDFNADQLWLSRPPAIEEARDAAETAAGDETRNNLYAIEAMLELVHPEDREEVRQAISSSLREDGPRDVASEYRALGASDEYHFYRTVSHTEHDQERGLLRLIGATLDITEIRSAEQEIRQLNADLEDRVRARTEELERAVAELEAFSYSVSHDLRSPLRAMAGYSDMIAEDPDSNVSPTAVGFLERIRTSSITMASMIDDLLSLARLTRAGRCDETVDLSAMVASLAEDLKQEYPDREVELRVQPGVVCRGDAGMLRLALQNLLSNAWKFTRGREPARIEFGRDEDGSYFMRDNGVGFDAKQKLKLFRPFERLHRGDEFEGSGIGLATVARIVRRHGGDVDAEGKIGGGATFRFTLDPEREDPVLTT